MPENSNLTRLAPGFGWASSWSHCISCFHNKCGPHSFPSRLCHTSTGSLNTGPDLSGSPCFHLWSKAIGLNDVSDAFLTSHGYGKFRFVHGFFSLEEESMKTSWSWYIHAHMPVSSPALFPPVKICWESLAQTLVVPPAFFPTLSSDALHIPGPPVHRATGRHVCPVNMWMFKSIPFGVKRSLENHTVLVV